MTTVTIEQERVGDYLETAVLMGLRLPDLGGAVPGAERTLTWTPDLSPAEVTLARAVASAVRLTVAERNALQADIDGLTTYNGIATPTLAQTAAATKAQNRILRALLRD